MPHRLKLEELQALLFDVDGTLVDSMGMIVPGLCDTIEKFAGTRPNEEEIRSVVGMPITAQLNRYLPLPVEDEEMVRMVDYAIDRYKLYQDRVAYFHEAVEFLRLCRTFGKKIALVTSKNARELQDFMTEFHASDAIDVAVCASDVPNPKPEPDSARLALEKLGVQPSQAAFIGDSIYDLRCAKAAGIAAVAVSYGSASQADLEAEGPEMLFKTPADLLHWATSTEDNHASQESRTTRLIDTNSRSEGAA